MYPDAFKTFLRAKEPEFQNMLLNGLALKKN